MDGSLNRRSFPTSSLAVAASMALPPPASARGQRE